MSKIVSIATEVPPNPCDQDSGFHFTDAIYSRNETDSRKLKYLFRKSGIETRYSVVPDYQLAAADRLFYAPTPDLEPFPNLEKRMEWYAAHAGPLSVKAIRKCIAGKIDEAQITHLITVSCTGMSAPGLDLEIMETMGLRPSLSRTSINFMGCYAAIHGLKAADLICKVHPEANVIVVCTELCTLHFQKENSVDNITSSLIFADGCAAVWVQGDAAIPSENPQSEKACSGEIDLSRNPKHKLKGLRLENFYSEVAFKGKKDMSWALSSKGFLMTLSGYVPELVKEDFAALTSHALQSADLTQEDITHWCIHPGGKKILEAIQTSLSLSPDQLSYSYETLREYGNMSSPTILFVLKKILDELQEKPAKIFAAAFGPGLTMETFIASYD